MHASQLCPGKLHQAVTKAAYEWQSAHKVENRSWLIDLKATALYILLLSRDLGNYRPRILLIFGTIGSILNETLRRLDHIHII